MPVGNELYQKELSYATPFCWTKTAITAPAGQTLTATIENAQMFELALRDATGALVPVTAAMPCLMSRAKCQIPSAS